MFRRCIAVHTSYASVQSTHNVYVVIINLVTDVVMSDYRVVMPEPFVNNVEMNHHPS